MIWGLLDFLFVAGVFVAIVLFAIHYDKRTKRASERLAEPRHSRARLGFTEDEIRARADLYIAQKSSPRGSGRRAA